MTVSTGHASAVSTMATPQPPRAGEQPQDDVRGDDDGEQHPVLAPRARPSAVRRPSPVVDGAPAPRARRTGRNGSVSARPAASRRVAPPAVAGLPLALSAAAASRRPGAGRVRGSRRAPSRRYSVASQLRSSVRPASPDFSGWNWVADSGPFSTAATNGAPCSARSPAAADRRALAARPRTRTAARRRSARSRSARPRRPSNSAVPAGGSTVFQPMCGTTSAPRGARPRPASTPRPSTSWRAVLVAALEQHLHADADPEHRGARRRSPRPTRVRRRERCSPSMHGRERADAGDDEAVGRRGAASRSAVT